MVYVKAIVLRGKRVIELIGLLNLNMNWNYDCIYVTYDFKFCIGCNYKVNIKKGSTTVHKEIFINKLDIKKIMTVYNITGDLESSMLYLFKD